jgi:UDP-4-amino-4,6-dideoxy-N-acetyl-beta-L-altrosamine transaminase
MIPYGRQSIDEDDVSAVVSALKSEWLTTGPLVEIFEEMLEEVVGAPCIAVSSGTAALHCAYAAIGFEPGDEVITPPITFIATQAAAELVGAKVVFADIQTDTANIDPKAVAAAITSKTRAIVAVDFAGHPADLDELRALADKNGILLVEDAAHSIGSLYKGRPVGSIADITTFSFFPTKNITTGEGGAVASRNPALLERARKFSRQGLIRDPDAHLISGQGPWHQEVHRFGLNYRLPDVLCALGISQIKKLHEFKNQKSLIFSRYNELLEGIRTLQTPIEKSYVSSNWHLFPIRVDAKIRLEVFNSLRDKGIGVQVNYIPAYWHPVFQKLGYKKGMFPVSDTFYSQEISLPMFASLTQNEVQYVAETLRKLV